MNTGRSIRPVLAALSILTALCGAGCRPDEVSPGLLIDDVTIVDGRDSTPLPAMSVLVRGDTIEAVAPAGSFDAGTGVERLDGAGRYLVPGLWDMHTHALWEPFFSDGYLALFVAHGVTGIRDMGGELDVLRRVDAGERPGGVAPHIVASGPALDLQAPDRRAMTRVETPDEARAVVAELDRAGADFVKVYLTLPEPAFLAAVEAARERGLPLAGHVPLEVDPARAALLGMRSIEHMQAEIGGYCDPTIEGDCEPLFELFRRLPCWQTPTLLVRRNRAHLDDPDLFDAAWLRRAPPYLVAEWREMRRSRLAETERIPFEELRRRWARERRLATALIDARVPMLVGSDAGDLYSVAGFGLHQELALMVEAGLSTRGALRAATLGAAEYLAQEQSFGTVEVGRRADLLLVEGDPLADLGTLSRPLAVILAGRLLARSELDDLLAALPHRSNGSADGLLE